MLLPRLLPLAVLCLVVLPAARPAEDDAKKKILKLFVSEFVHLTPGKGKFPATVKVGSSARDARASEKPVVTVKLSRPFAIAKYEVTQELYELVMGKNPAKWKGKLKDGKWTGNRNSVEMLTHPEAVTFCKKVTKLLRDEKLIKADQFIRLPSEAEWEYACRAGTTTPFSFSDEKKIGEYAWYSKNSKGEDPPVGKKKPNPWGLHEMHGYVWEWCADAWVESLKDLPTDGTARVVKDAKEFVIRGGSFADPPEDCSSTARQGKPAGTKSDRIGFRCVLDVEKKPKGGDK